MNSIEKERKKKNVGERFANDTDKVIMKLDEMNLKRTLRTKKRFLSN